MLEYSLSLILWIGLKEHLQETSTIDDSRFGGQINARQQESRQSMKCI